MGGHWPRRHAIKKAELPGWTPDKTARRDSGLRRHAGFSLPDGRIREQNGSIPTALRMLSGCAPHAFVSKFRETQYS
jgi:hypothetical protein